MTIRSFLTAFLLSAIVARAVLGATYAVDDTADDADASQGDGVCATTWNTCTLRAAIGEANASPGTDTVAVTAVAGTIRLASSIVVTEPVTLVGPATLSGAVASGGITSQWPLVIDGSGTTENGLIVSVGADGSVISGFAFTGFPASYDHGAILLRANACTIRGNTFFGNGRPLFVSGNRNEIGGTGDGDGNLLLDNGEVAISITGDGNVVEGNMAGTNGLGTEAHPNHNGVSIEADAADNVIGGATSASRNLFSGNVALGVHVDGPRNTGTIIRNNYIGVAIDGVTPLCDAQGSIDDEGTASIIDHNVEACRITGCCKYHGTSTNFPGLTCLDSAVFKTRIFDCATQVDPAVVNDTAEYTNPDAKCEPEGDLSGTCPEPASPTASPTPTVEPTRTPSPQPVCAEPRWLRLHRRDLRSTTDTLDGTGAVMLLNPPGLRSLYIRSIAVTSTAATTISLASGSRSLGRLNVPAGKTRRKMLRHPPVCLPPPSGLIVQQTGVGTAVVTIEYALR